MKLLYAAPYFSPAKSYGGPVTAATSLCRVLASGGIEIRVITSDADGPRRIRREMVAREPLNGVEVHYSKRFLSELWAPGLAWQALKGIVWADAAYVWGAFFWALPLVSWACLFARRPLLVSPGGMLFEEALAAKSFKKRLHLWLAAPFGRPLFHLHATSDAEAAAIKARWPKAEVTVIPNGVEMPELRAPAGPSEAKGVPTPYLLYLGRLHPHKRVDRIVKAFAAVAKNEKEGSEPSLFIAGAGDANCEARLKKLSKDLGLASRVHFLGHIEGAEKSRLLANAHGLVLASKSENFGMSVAEALAHGTPCVVTKTAPWEGLERERCGFWVDDSEEALADGMRRMMALSPEERRAMGERGREWMKRDFSWESVAKQMLKLYQELLDEKMAQRSGKF